MALSTDKSFSLKEHRGCPAYAHQLPTTAVVPLSPRISTCSPSLAHTRTHDEANKGDCRDASLHPELRLRPCVPSLHWTSTSWRRRRQPSNSVAPRASTHLSADLIANVRCSHVDDDDNQCTFRSASVPFNYHHHQCLCVSVPVSDMRQTAVCMSRASCDLSRCKRLQVLGTQSTVGLVRLLFSSLSPSLLSFHMCTRTLHSHDSVSLVRTHATERVWSVDLLALSSDISKRHRTDTMCLLSAWTTATESDSIFAATLAYFLPLATHAAVCFVCKTGPSLVP